MPIASHAAEPDRDSLSHQIESLSAMVRYLVETHNLAPLNAPTSDALRESINSGTDWLILAQESDGHFAYEYAPYEGTYLSGDNIVRQAGALYELGEVLRRQQTPDPAIAAAMESSIAYFEGLTREDTFLKVTAKCIVEHENSDRCKLGATSLALLGILSYIDVYPEKAAQYDDLIDGYVKHILNSKHIRGTFRSLHYIGSHRQPNKESSFADGEAVLALVRYYQYKQSGVVKSVVEDSIEELKGREFDSPLYLWIMAALKDWQHIEPNADYVSYAEEFTNWRVSRVAPYKSTRKNYCAYAEGLASAYSILKDEVSSERAAALRRELDYWNARNLRLQVDASTRLRYAEGDDGSLTLLSIDDMDTAEGGFLTSQDVLTQRIDFTQHCISASLQTLVDIDNEAL